MPVYLVPRPTQHPRPVVVAHPAENRRYRPSGKTRQNQAGLQFPAQSQNVIDALKACDEGDPYYFWSGQGTTKTMITEWQERMKKACAIAGIQGGGYFHRLRDTFSVRLLEKRVQLETVAVLLGNTVQVCRTHYAPWVKSRQTALESAVKGTWA